MSNSFLSWVERHWYGNGPAWIFLPLQPLYVLIGLLRRSLYRLGLLPSWQAPVATLVVGNLSVGGTGKTPLTIALVEAAQAQGLRVAVVSRGYGRDSEGTLLVTESSTAKEVGDEPLLIKQRTGALVAISSKRVDAVRAALESAPVDLIIADDGLQHYALARDTECVVVDSQRGFGNGWQLPCGPLREPLSRLRDVDALVTNQRGGDFVSDAVSTQAPMTLKGELLVNLISGEKRPLSQFSGKTVSALAGIGNPDVFFNKLSEKGLNVTPLRFGDHHDYQPGDLPSPANLLVMTEKDAVKVTAFAHGNCWFLPVEADLPSGFADNLIHLTMKKFKQRQA